jgi:hypothetical protein
MYGMMSGGSMMTHVSPFSFSLIANLTESNLAHASTLISPVACPPSPALPPSSTTAPDLTQAAAVAVPLTITLADISGSQAGTSIQHIQAQVQASLTAAAPATAFMGAQHSSIDSGPIMATPLTPESATEAQNSVTIATLTLMNTTAASPPAATTAPTIALATTSELPPNANAKAPTNPSGSSSTIGT